MGIHVGIQPFVTVMHKVDNISITFATIYCTKQYKVLVYKIQFKPCEALFAVQ